MYDINVYIHNTHYTYSLTALWIFRTIGYWLIVIHHVQWGYSLGVKSDQGCTWYRIYVTSVCIHKLRATDILLASNFRLNQTTYAAKKNVTQKTLVHIIQGFWFTSENSVNDLLKQAGATFRAFSFFKPTVEINFLTLE